MQRLDGRIPAGALGTGHLCDVCMGGERGDTMTDAQHQMSATSESAVSGSIAEVSRMTLPTTPTTSLLSTSTLTLAAGLRGEEVDALETVIVGVGEACRRGDTASIVAALVAQAV